MVVAEPTEAFEIAVWRGVHPTRALHGLGENRGDSIAVLGEEAGGGLDVVALHLLDAGHHLAPALAVERQALGTGAAEVHPVVAAVTADDDLTVAAIVALAPGGAGAELGHQAADLERGVDGLGARTAEEDAAVGVRRQ